VWPEVELADARAKRDEARRLLAKGIDPAQQTKLDKITASVAAANTFQAVVDEWLAKIEREDLSPVTLKKNRWSCHPPKKGDAITRPVHNVKLCYAYVPA
jgi:hypothetical protein